MNLYRTKRSSRVPTTAAAWMRVCDVCTSAARFSFIFYPSGRRGSSCVASTIASVLVSVLSEVSILQLPFPRRRDERKIAAADVVGGGALVARVVCRWSVKCSAAAKEAEATAADFLAFMHCAWSSAGG